VVLHLLVDQDSCGAAGIQRHPTHRIDPHKRAGGVPAYRGEDVDELTEVADAITAAVAKLDAINVPSSRPRSCADEHLAAGGEARDPSGKVDRSCGPRRVCARLS
jgi:hypothetical protein